MARLYIGIDLGWKDIRFEVRSAKGNRLKKGGVPATPEGLKKLLKEYEALGSEVQVAYEAGSQMYWVDRVIKEMGMDSYPFHAADFLIIVKSKNKSDKKDAQKIAVEAAKGNLPRRVYVPSEIEKELRDLVQERHAYQKNINEWGNRLHALAISLGFQLEKSTLSEEKAWLELLEQFQGKSKEKAKRFYNAVAPFFQNLEKIEEEMRAVRKDQEFAKAIKILESIPGIGRICSTALIAWCGPEAARFLNGRHAASYFGLVKRNYQSGQTDRNGSITKSGPELIRKYMVQAAWAFMRSFEGQKSLWGRWAAPRLGKGKKKNKDLRKRTIVALARKLITAAIACLQKGTMWDNRVLEAFGK